MSTNDPISNALRALAEHDRDLEAPEHVEIHLVRAIRQNRARRKRQTIVLASLTAAAAIAFFVVRPQEPPKQIPPAPEQTQAVSVAAVPAPVEKPVAKIRPVKRPPRELVTEFFPLLDVAPPFERGELLRVTVPAATMRKVGLPVNENRLSDRVYADVLIGDEGLARAIRFVSFEQ